MLKITGKVDYYFDQLGIDTPAPRFSWRIDDPPGGLSQVGFRIRAAESAEDLRSGCLIWDSGFVADGKATGAVYAGAALGSVTKYYWTVELEIRGTGGDFACSSDTLSFVTGKQGAEVSLGNWITNGAAKPFYARRTLEINRPVAEAYALICGLGQFNFFLNGEKVSNHIIDPGWTNYDKSIKYVMFDIAPYLRSGPNAFCAEVGNGWYIGDAGGRYFHKMPPDDPAFSFIPENPNPYKPFSRCLALCGEIHIVYADGSREVVACDDSWRVRHSATKLANVYGSEIFDSTDFPDGWTGAGFDDSGWENAVFVSEDDKPKGELSSQGQPPSIISKTYEAVKMSEPRPGCVLADFGQNMSAVFEISVRGKRGAAVDIYPAEKLGPDGDIDQKANGWVEIKNRLTYVLAGSGQQEIWKPAFSYCAGRYILIQNATLDPENSEFPYLHRTLAHFVTSASMDTGEVDCGDVRFMQVYDIVKKAIESNLQSVHTDCPSIEKFAWQETNHLMAPSVMFIKDVSELWNKIFTDMRYEQHTGDDCYFGPDGSALYPGDGLIPSQAPCYERMISPVPGKGSFYDTIPWGSSIILAVYWHYMFYGDIGVVGENYSAGKRYIGYLRSKINADGFINHGLGDWGNPEPGSLARENIETAFYYADLTTMAYFAGELNMSDDKKLFEDEAARVRDNYNDKLLAVDPDTGLWCYRVFEHKDGVSVTQACLAMPLYWRMVPDDKRGDVIDSFIHLLKKDKAFSSGEIGLRYIIQTMRALGLNDMVCEFMLREEHPGYYRFVKMGETTLPEYWEDNARSHNHDMMGHIAEWYYNGIAGILIEEPGFAKITVKPYLPKGMERFSCKYKSVRGVISVEMDVAGDALEYRVSVPGSISAAYDMSLLESAAQERELRLVVKD